jgi:hypothetical protein
MSRYLDQNRDLDTLLKLVRDYERKLAEREARALAESIETTTPGKAMPVSKLAKAS